MPDNNEIVLIRLREAIETATGRQMRTPKDFSFLSERIFDKLHEHISPTTLKRLWGYLHDTSSTPRPSTLDLLAQFIDYPDFDTFATTVAPTFATTVNVSYDLSDTTRVVWYRVDNDVDLNNLDYLRRHRF